MPTNNTLSSLNDHLFTQLGRLSGAKGDNLKTEIERTRSMAMLSNSMIENAKLALEVQLCLGGKGGTPGMLQVEAPK